MENLPILIRKAETDDIDNIMNVERLSFHSNVIESQKVFEDRISLFSDGFLVAETEKDGKKTIVGYISSELWSFSKEIQISNFNLNHSIFETHCSDGEELYISSIAIDPQFRGNGIGKHLFTYLLDSVSNKYKLKSAILLVNSDWQSAHKMYRNEEFEEIGKILNFFPITKKDNENHSSGTGIIMRKYFE